MITRTLEILKAFWEPNHSGLAQGGISGGVVAAGNPAVDDEVTSDFRRFKSQKENGGMDYNWIIFFKKYYIIKNIDN